MLSAHWRTVIQVAKQNKTNQNKTKNNYYMEYLILTVVAFCGQKKMTIYLYNEMFMKNLPTRGNLQVCCL